MKAYHLLLPLLILTLTACANPGSGPDGGPYDETPPRIVATSPLMGATASKPKKVTITFDENIKVENAQEKIIVSPPQIEAPEIKASGRHISISLLDTLKEQTTYTIDFSDAIVDNNEGNPLGNFTYYFSTGERLDTMEVSGYVLGAEDLEPQKGLMVGLHTDLSDSVFLKQPLVRVARTDATGHFVIKGVAPGKYFIYALGDMDGDFRYTYGETLAWSRDTISPTCFPDIRHDTIWADTAHIDTIITRNFTHFRPDNIVLFASTEKRRDRLLLKTERDPAYFRAYFTAPSNHRPQVKGLNFDERDAFIEQRSPRNDTITYWLRDTLLVNQDTLRLAYTYEATNDSTGLNSLVTDTLECIPRVLYARRMELKQQEKAKFEKQRERRHRRGDYSLETMPTEPLQVRYTIPTELSPDRNLHFDLPEPAARVDTAAFHLYLKEDSMYVDAPFRLTRDSLNLLGYTLRAEWRPGQEYVINIDSAAFIGLSGRCNEIRDQKFRIATEETYGSLFLLIPDAPQQAYVDLLAANGTLIKRVAVNDARADFYYLQPTTCYLRLVADTNGNGRWDEANYDRQQQPETVYYFPYELTIRANWDVEQTWHIKALPHTRQKPAALVKQKAENKKTPRNLNAERERDKRK